MKSDSPFRQDKPAEKGEEVYDGDVLTLGNTSLRLNLYTEEA